MNRNVLRNCLPDARQELLLHAALQKGEQAGHAWNEWKRIVQIEHIDHASYRLLPLVYNNLKSEFRMDPLMQRIKGVYRHTWSKNQHIMQTAGKLLCCFHEAAISTMLLKGSALLLTYYENYGLRPMNDVDILIPYKFAKEAIRLLKKNDYAPCITVLPFSERHIPLVHGYSFSNSCSPGVDLHWHVLPECREQGADDDFWKDSLQMEFAGASVHVLNAADQLFHTCVHGMRWDPVPPIRWVADAMMILRSSNKMDWHRLIHQCKQRGLVLPVLDALQYLQDIFNPAIPAYVFEKLRETPASWIQRSEYRYKLQNHTNQIWGNLPFNWFSYCRSVNGTSSYKKVIGFIDYQKDYWGANSRWQLPALISTRLLRKIRYVITSR